MAYGIWPHGEPEELFQWEWYKGLTEVGLTEYGRRKLGNIKYSQLFQGRMP